MRTPLTAEALESARRALPLWEISDQAVRRELTFVDFAQAIGFVTRISILAEKMDHHPDIDIRYRNVVISLRTHDVGAVTDWDIRLADQIEAALTT